MIFPVGSQVVRIVYPLNPQPFTYQRLSDLNSLQTERESYLFSLEETDSGTYTTIYGVGKLSISLTLLSQGNYLDFEGQLTFSPVGFATLSTCS